MRTAYSRSRSASLTVVLVLILFGGILATGCATEKKAKRWLDSNPVKASQYCAINFPVKEDVQVVYKVDSVPYNNAVDSVKRFADSILNAAKAEGRDTQYIERIRDRVHTEIRYKLRPCVDSVKEVIRTVENTAKVKYLSGVIDQKDATISQRDARVTALEDKAASRLKWLWILIIICAAQSLYLTRKLWMPLITKLPL